MTKVTIFSGFLGAGKTTLIKKLISEAYKGEKLVLIENEFGEIGIDGGFMKEAGIEVTEMNSGCICCTLVGDFGRAMRRVLDEFHPDRILIEPSGVGKLSDVIGAVRELDSDVELSGFVTVADASKCRVYMRNFGEFYNNQIENASAIILSRTDHISPEKLDAAVSLLRGCNADAPIVTTPWDKLSGAQLLDVIEQKESLANVLDALCEEEHRQHSEGCSCCHDHEHEHGHCHEHEHEHHHEHEHCHEHEHHHDHCHEHHHHADEVFTSWGKESPRTFSADDIRAVLNSLDSGRYGTVLRAKGIVPAADGTWLYFDYVPGEQNIRTGSADYSGRFCVIGSDLDENALEALFDGKEHA